MVRLVTARMLPSSTSRLSETTDDRSIRRHTEEDADGGITC